MLSQEGFRPRAKPYAKKGVDIRMGKIKPVIEWAYFCQVCLRILKSFATISLGSDKSLRTFPGSKANCVYTALVSFYPFF